MDINQRTLKNNLNTLFINSKGSTASSVQIWFRAGSALEEKSNQGIAHFLEHMFFKGTKKRPGAKIAHEVESFGGEINAFTSFDYTCYYINCPNDHIGKTVDILMDMVSNPEFKESELIPERQVVFEEYRRSLDNPNHYNFQNLQNSSFQKGYKHPILGTPKTILNFSRDQLIYFRKKFYNTNNAMLVVAGDFNENALTKTIEKYKMPQGENSSFPVFNQPKKPTLNIHEKAVKQASITLSIHAPEYLTKESAREDLAINCLAYGETSRLYQELVLKETLATSVSGSTMFFSKKGTHLIKINFPLKNLKKILKKTQNVLKDVSKNGFSLFELEKIKNIYIASKVYELESLEGSAFSLGHGFAQNGDIKCEDQFIERLKEVSLDQMNEAFNHIGSRVPHITVQLPEKTKNDSIKKELENFMKTFNSQFITTKKISKKKKESASKDPYLTEKQIAPGVTFLHRYNPTAPTFVLHAYLKGGLMNEDEKSNGIYHLISKGLTYGYNDISYDKLKNDLANMSASLSGFAGKNAFGITSHAQTKDFEKILAHFMGSLFHPKFPKEYIDHEKTIANRILENHEEDPVKQCFKAFNKSIFKNHHYALNILGSEESLKKLTPEVISKRHKGDLENKEILITYCGSQNFDEVYPLIFDYIKDLKGRKKQHISTYKLGNFTPEDIHLYFDREQTQIFMGYPAFSITQKEQIYLKILSSHLSGQSSELFVDVRDKKGLCYAVQPVHFAALESGYWGIYIGAGADKTKQAKKAISDIFKKLADKGFKLSELNRVKKMIKGQQKLNIQTHNDYANLYSIPVLHGLGSDFALKNLEMIENIKLEEFNSFLKRFFKRKPTIVSAGPVIEK